MVSRYGNKLMPIEEVEAFVEKYNCKLVNRERLDGVTIITYIASCGHECVKTNKNYLTTNTSLCVDCARKLINNTSWAYNKKKAERNKVEWRKKKAHLYIIKLYNECESFYKIGVASGKIKTRIRQIKTESNKLGVIYESSIVKVFDSNLYEVVIMEQELHEINKENSYTPSIKFGGYTECFSEISDAVYDKIKEVSQNGNMR